MRTDANRPAPRWAAIVGFILVALYPLGVYLGLSRYGVRAVAFAVIALGIPAALLRGWGRQSGIWATLRPLWPALALVAASAMVEDARLLMAFPVLVSALLLVGFAGTLRAGRMSMVERFARTTEPELPDGGVEYCRTVTKVWCGFFVANAVIAGTLAVVAPVGWWAAYTGVGAYAAIGLLFAAEYVVRKARFRRYGPGWIDRLLGALLGTGVDRE